MSLSPQLLQNALRLTAVMNVTAGALALLAPQFFGGLLYGRDVTLDPLLYRHHQMLWAFILAMGLGYAAAAWEAPRPGLAILVAGGVGKLLAAAMWVEMIAHGTAMPIVALAVTFDGSLGLLLLAAAAGALTTRTG